MNEFRGVKPLMLYDGNMNDITSILPDCSWFLFFEIEAARTGAGVTVKHRDRIKANMTILDRTLGAMDISPRERHPE
jgi:hypothetical protein